MPHSTRLAALLFVLLVPSPGAWAQTATQDPLDGWIAHVERIVPSAAAGFDASLPEKLAAATDAIEQWAVDRATYRTSRSLDSALATTRQLLEAKRRVDAVLDRTLSLRSQIAEGQPQTQAVDDPSRDRIRDYLRSTSRLIDLSGRLRYLQHDALNTVASRFCKSVEDQERFVSLLIEQKSSIGAVAAAPMLNAETETPKLRRRAANASRELYILRSKIIFLIAVTRETSCLGHLVKLLEREDVPPTLAIQAAETIRFVGLPQASRANNPADLPAPAIEPKRLAELVERISASGLDAKARERLVDLKAWLAERVEHGITDGSYRFGSIEVRPGDWLLMRNPSPYNMFTDLSPGLFTHVGVVTSERGSDGVTRMVIVDLPERGRMMPATNVEIFLERTLHYVFLRDPDPEVAEQMAEAARQTIGNETEFDLNFRTERVLELKGQKLAGRKIRTYCAGMLLVCALQTDVDRREFFPLDEYAAGGLTVENLAKLGMSFGAQFISPTGAVFSPRLKLVGTREPMYDPAREIEESVFDRFATELINRPLRPTADLFDGLTVKIAAAASQNPLLAKALAKAAGVGDDVDLVAAARASAVVETLDDVAFDASDDFRAAREAVRVTSFAELRQEGFTDEELEVVREYRKAHPDLVKEFERGQLSPRKLRTTLVSYYSQAGRREIDRRFFEGQGGNSTTATAEGKGKTAEK
jgi:hypothetical protein